MATEIQRDDAEAILADALKEAEAIAERARSEIEELHSVQELDPELFAARGSAMIAAIDQLRTHFALKFEELVPAAPASELYAELGTAPASAEQFAAFVSEHKIPGEDR